MRLLKDSFEVQDNTGLAWWKTLPFDFQRVRVSGGTRPSGFRFSKFIVNIEAELNETKICVCGEANTNALAMTKAIMELVERASLIQWSRGTHAEHIHTSNGWAAHETLEKAKTNAVLELAERDAVLAQWYLSMPFLEISPDSWPDEIAEWSCSELAQSEFPNMKLFLSTEGLGPSLTCLFLDERGYGVSGHATKSTLVESIDSAVAETCRAAHHTLRRSFWADSLTLLRQVNGARVQPGAHAVYYAYHEPFPHWMFGSSLSWRAAEQIWSQRIDSLLNRDISDFEFHQVLDDPVVVGFASHPRAYELTWGPTDIHAVFKMTEDRKSFVSEMKERSLNIQPHIVS